MADTVKLQLAAHHRVANSDGGTDIKAPGDTIEVEAADARRLIAGGIGVPATVPDAKAAGVEPDAAATKK